ncbi:hypothetical protein E2C01_030348 [Portunus trituberculatus]|uniref:Uncharacterized protein n=1 Tax=Portunus trituberculatus TaxID=210409 RepID=A0A5B7EV39_PORTR|nr:hypothetical protein [Portunus trituberculatus]
MLTFPSTVVRETWPCCSPLLRASVPPPCIPLPLLAELVYVVCFYDAVPFLFGLILAEWMRGTSRATIISSCFPDSSPNDSLKISVFI